NGGIDIVCADSIDARGDLNLNGISNEIADAVVYTNYFVYGLSAFNVNLEGQIAASDVNADGLTLSVADLVYLIRIVVGDANPFPKVVETVNAEYTHNRAGVMSVVGETQMGAAFVVVEGDASPELLASDMEMRYNYDGVNTRILVYSMQANDFSGDFLQVTGDIVSIEMATSDGSIVATKELPTEFALNQNYPNPFNPSTTVSFSLPTASDYDLRIYNVNGQEVATFSGHAEAGIVELEWEASNLASGIYFYKLSADNFSDTKKMVLLK
ncbi:MAG: T9SS type A sorting domain-containing protein, partial [Candidatus Zixiibacteriota bacterium]